MRRMVMVREATRAEMTQFQSEENKLGELQRGVNQPAGAATETRADVVSAETKHLERVEKGAKVTQEVKKPEEVRGEVDHEVKSFNRRGQEVRIQTMRAREAEDPDVERFGYGGWAGEFFDKFRRHHRSK
ncbi:hypothetical protein TWF481_005953 [Arthrobotrys musiformis]|uniref:Uncharacterized protein n=1 Tax=Arthrobotrys musiformis TaxID=47236 RepID=A0AAV9WFB7_9PEZI